MLTRKQYSKTSKKFSLVHPRFGIVMILASIQMDHGSELSVHTSSSRGNTFGNPKHERDHPSGVLLWSSPELMASASCYLWFFIRQKITPRIFTGTSPVTGYSTTRRRDIWTGMAGWRQWVSSVGPVELSRSTPRSSYLAAMTATSMKGPHIFSDPTTSPHLSSRQATPPTTRQMITGPIWSWRGSME